MSLEDWELKREYEDVMLGEALKSLTDDELINFNKTGDLPANFLPSADFNASDYFNRSGLRVAGDSEARRRLISSGWIWKRLFNRQRYERFYRHVTELDIKLGQDFLNDITSKNYNSPENEMTKEILESYLDEKKREL